MIVNTTLELQQLTRQEMLNLCCDAAGQIMLPQSKVATQTQGIPTRKLKTKERAKLLAAFYWLNEYQPDRDASNLEQVKGYLEAFHHLCHASIFVEAQKILFIPIQIAQIEQALHKQLGNWGYYREQIELYSRLKGKQDAAFDCFLLNGLGEAYYSLGQPQPALLAYEEQLAIARTTINRNSEVEALGGLGRVAFLQCQDRKAIAYYQQQWEIALETQNLQQQAIALSELARSYCINKPVQTVRVSKKALAISREIGDLKLTATTLSRLAAAYSFLGKSRQAILIMEKQLEISRELDDLELKKEGLRVLGHISTSSGKYEAALHYLLEYLQISREAGNRFDEVDALNSTGATYARQGKYEEALRYLREGTEISAQIGDDVFRGFTLSNASHCYNCLSEFAKAEESYKEAMHIACQLKNRRMRITAEIARAHTLWLQGKRLRGLLLAIKEMFMLRPWQTEEGRFMLRKTIELVREFLMKLLKQLRRVDLSDY
ncbi:tetratricopeptide repeat protein [Tumidithrix elongata RA019]|uniref:Tetratricopeptide repeat protein n=1 Tax=Tumidithrix elongata BACA0141 TaxID=2716417 RepID=A0AAW9Q318_9CYAN|nr:tetratricopeptide repeat protein [Tumidithrix elongata RA019]